MPRLSVTPFVVASCLLFSVFSASANAGKVYRWVDANGQVHFGSQPPPEQRNQAEQYHIQVQPVSSSATSTSATDGKGDDEKMAEEEDKAVLNTPISAEKSKEYCNNAREFMVALQSGNNTRFQQEDGSVRPFTAEERSSKEKQALRIIDQFCAKQK